MRCRVAVAIALSFGAASAQAADWEVLPFGSIGGYYESNLGLSPVNAEELGVSGATASAGFALRATTPVSELVLRPYGRSTYFPGDTDSDYNNAFADLEYKREGQRSRISMLGQFASETVTSRALPSTTPRGDLGNPLDSDINAAGTRSRRKNYSIYPSLSVDVTQRNQLVLNAARSFVAYDRKLPGEELGYHYTQGSLGWGFNFTPLNQLSVAAGAEEFNPADAAGFSPSVGSRTYSVTARWSRTLSEKQRWYVQAGGTDTRFDRVAGVPTVSKSGYVGGAGASWEMQKSVLFADLVHRVQPSSSGAVSSQTDARLLLVRNFTPRWSGDFGVRYIRSDAISETTTTDYRDFGTVNIAAEWRWTRTVAVKGELAWVRQKLENQPRPGNSQSATLSISYDAGRINQGN
jgi:hypothetical protein